jgi:hypothetical protein
LKARDTDQDQDSADKDRRVRQVKKGKVVQRPKIKVNKVNDLTSIPEPVDYIPRSPTQT